MLRSELNPLSASYMTTATPSDDRSSFAGERDVEKDSRRPMLIARSPFPDAAVETDMKKRTLPPSTLGSTHSSATPSYCYSGREMIEGQYAGGGGHPTPLTWSRDPSYRGSHQAQRSLTQHSSTSSSNSSSLGGTPGNGGGGGGGGSSDAEITWPHGTEHAHHIQRLPGEVGPEQLQTVPQRRYESSSVDQLSSLGAGSRHQNRILSVQSSSGDPSHLIQSNTFPADSHCDNSVGIGSGGSGLSGGVSGGGGGGGVSGGGERVSGGGERVSGGGGGGEGVRYHRELLEDDFHGSLYSSGSTSPPTYNHGGYSSLEESSSHHLQSLFDHPTPSYPPPSYPPSYHHSPSHHSHLHTLPNSPYTPVSHLQQSHQHQQQQHPMPPQPQPSQPLQLFGSNRIHRVPTGDYQSHGMQQSLQHNAYGSGLGESQASYHQSQPLPPYFAYSSSSSSGYPSLASSENVYSGKSHRHYYHEVEGSSLQPHLHGYSQHHHHQGQQSSLGAYSGQRHMSLQPASMKLEALISDSQPQGEQRCLPHPFHPLPPPSSSHYHQSQQRQQEGQQHTLEGVAYPQRQSPLMEGEPYPQRHSHSLEGESHLQGQPLTLHASRQNHLPLHDHNMAIPFSLEPPTHRQQTRPDQLALDDDYLAGETQRALSLHENTEDVRKISSGVSGQSHSNNIEITEHPRDATVETHQKAVFTCKALLLSDHSKKKVIEVDLEPQLQWYRGDAPLANEVMRDLILSDVGEEEAGSYYCVVTHPHHPSSSLRSNKAQLTVTNRLDEVGGAKTSVDVIKAPVITSQLPAKVTAVIGGELKLLLGVKGEEPINFRWFKDSQPLVYCQGKVLRVPSAAHSDSGQYYCTVSNSHGSILSEPCLVRVLRTKANEDAVPEGHQQRPTSLHNWEGNNVSDAFLRDLGRSISCQITNLNKLASFLSLDSPHLSRIRGQSMRHEEQVIGLLFCWRETLREDKSALKLRLARAGVNFDLLLSNIPGGQTMGRIVPIKPHIVLHPLSHHVIYGQEVNLRVEVEASPQSYNFQWYKNHARLEGKTDSKLVIRSAVDSDSGEYYCTVINTGGSVDSKIAFVTVKNPHLPPLLSSSESHFTGGSVHASHGELAMRWEAQHPQQPRQQYLQQQQLRQFRTHSHNVTGGGIGTGLYMNPAGMSAGGGGGSSSGHGGGHHPREWGYSDNYHSMREDDQPRGQGEGSTAPPGREGHGLGEEPRKPMIGEEGLSISEDQTKNRAETTDILVSVSGTPVILEHPLSQNVDVGGPLSLSCRAVGLGDLTYLWYFNGLSITMETRPEYFINCFTDEDEGVYFCRVSNCRGSVDSRMAQVHMKEDD